jgi:hypothetical protein
MARWNGKGTNLKTMLGILKRKPSGEGEETSLRRIHNAGKGGAIEALNRKAALRRDELIELF